MLSTLILTICCSVLAETEAEALQVVVQRNVPVPMRDGIILRADVLARDAGIPV